MRSLRAGGTNMTFADTMEIGDAVERFCLINLGSRLEAAVDALVDDHEAYKKRLQAARDELCRLHDLPESLA